MALLSKLRSLRTVGVMFRAWWVAPVDYAAQVAYFERRGLLGGVQLLVSACAVLIAVIPVVAQFSVAGPATPAARMVSLAFTISAIAWAVVWSFGPWPSRRRSVAFIVYADIGIVRSVGTRFRPPREVVRSQPHAAGVDVREVLRWT